MTLSLSQRRRKLSALAGPLANVKTYRDEAESVWITRLECRACRRYSTQRAKNDSTAALIEWLDHLDDRHPNEDRRALVDFVWRAEQARP